MSTSTPEATVQIDVQALARQLLRRLMAERNVRTTGITKVIGVESHTVRRMLNGSRAISLDELILIAQLGGYSLDELFKLNTPSVTQSSAARDAALVNDGLGRVFAAIAELLTAAPAGAHNFESRDSLLNQRRSEPAPRDMSAQLSARAQESLDRILAGGEKRKRGRPSKVA